MPADELGSIWSSDPVRVSQSIKPVGKELDREKKRQQQESELPDREDDSVELTAVEDETLAEQVTVNQHNSEDDGLIPGANIDVTIG